MVSVIQLWGACRSSTEGLPRFRESALNHTIVSGLLFNRDFRIGVELSVMQDLTIFAPSVCGTNIWLPGREENDQ